VYEIDGGNWAIGRQLAMLQLILIIFSFLSIFSMIITYIAQNRGKMNFLIIENINLLDKMHEGLVLVDEQDMDLKFATIPAVTILTQ